MTTLLALDLEFNQPSGRIIQIGAAIGTVGGPSVEKTFCALVNPNEPLSPEISKLTGIEERVLVREGTSLPNAFAELCEFALRAESRFLNPLTWGGADGEELREQLGLPLEHWIFGRRWIDVKTLHVVNCLVRGNATQGGLAKSMLGYGLRFEGRKHNARDDAINTLRLFLKMTQLSGIEAPPSSAA